MSTVSSNLSLPYIQANQAQKHVTHNEGMRILDSLTQLSVISAAQVTPPVSPTPGDRYIVGAGATGAWAGYEAQLSVWDENTWRFFPATEGWVAWDQSSSAQIVFSAGQWVQTDPPLQNLDMIGINTTADATNRLAVLSDATLLSHDTTGDHQLKINKDTTTDTSSLLFQTGWSARAELGTMGGDDFSIKTSPDGATFNVSMVADVDTGAVSFPSGVTGLVSSSFGNEQLLTVDYISSRGTDLVTNGTGLLGNNYNFPTDFAFDPSTTPNLPGSFVFEGYGGGVYQSTEFLPVDPNLTYRLKCYIRHEAMPGDWSSHPDNGKHHQFMGLLCFDVDRNQILSHHHMRYRSGGADSMTTLTTPLTPGDTIINLANAAGWNDNNTSPIRRGITIFGYQNSFGVTYDYYSRFNKEGLFDVSGVDKSTNTITLSNPLPSDLANPHDPAGTWPVGTRIANSNRGATNKYMLLNSFTPPVTDAWVAVQNYAGGLDNSGINRINNFPPGTAYVKLFWLPNYTNRSGGYAGYPDTGPTHRTWFSGASVVPDPLAVQKKASWGYADIKAPKSDYTTGAISLVPANLTYFIL